MRLLVIKWAFILAIVLFLGEKAFSHAGMGWRKHNAIHLCCQYYNLQQKVEPEGLLCYEDHIYALDKCRKYNNNRKRDRFLREYKSSGK